ncbi:MAG: radical SAM protein, partial [Planctomycetota bacterium]|nr:radical SAM protein [Planctomycetota bacterium]
FEQLAVETKIEGNKIVAKATGSLGGLVQPLVDMFFARLNSLKVIARKDGMLVYNLYTPPQPSEPGFRHIFRKIKQMALRVPVLPGTVNLAITTACQCRCVHCSASRFAAVGGKHLSTDELKRVVDQSLGLGASLVIFTGGEPLVRPDIFELIAHVDKSQAMVMIFTNGLGLTEDNVKKLADAGLSTLNISIDHLDPAKHDEWRAIPGCYKSALEGAARARKAGILTGISTYAGRDSLRSGALEELLKLGQREGFHEVTIFDTIPSGNFLNKTELVLTPEEKKDVVALAMRYHNSSHPMGVVAQAFVNSPAGGGCFGAHTQFYMTAFGDINPCDFNPITFGNVRKMPLDAIWMKMISHSEYACQRKECRMQNPDYRREYVEPIPAWVPLPIPIECYTLGNPAKSREAIAAWAKKLGFKEDAAAQAGCAPVAEATRGCYR